MYKLNLIQLIAFSFMIGWIGMDAIQADYAHKLFWGSALALGTAFFENAHGRFWHWLKNLNKKSRQKAGF